MPKQTPPSSPLVIFIPLLIAAVLIGVVVTNALSTKSTADIRSHASAKTILAQCTSACTNPQYKAFVKDPGKCALDCTNVSKKTTSCDTFCAANITGKGTVLCKQQCDGWVAADVNRCSRLCSVDTGDKGPLAERIKGRCIEECGAIEKGQKTCQQVYKEVNNGDFNNQIAGIYLNQCKKEFAQ
jgi:hypothetical protein